MNCKPVLAALGLVAAPLAAQRPAAPDSLHHPMMEAGPMSPLMGDAVMREMGPVLMKLMLYTPQHLLARKDPLALSADQITRLTALRDGAKAARDAGEAEAQAHLRELERAAGASKPDTTALKLHFQAAHAALGKAHWAEVSAAAQARWVLSDGQRSQMETWADSMQAWMQQHRKMMKPTSPR